MALAGWQDVQWHCVTVLSLLVISNWYYCSSFQPKSNWLLANNPQTLWWALKTNFKGPDKEDSRQMSHNGKITKDGLTKDVLRSWD